MTVACPGCVAIPEAEQITIGSQQKYSVPSINCASCISKIERGLLSLQGVRSARVNLSLKRLSVDGAVETEEVLEKLNELGFEAFSLDADALGTTEDSVGRNLLLRMAVAGFAMMNIMLLSVAVWSGATDTTRDLFHLISACIAIPVVAYSGQPFFVSAISALKKHRLNMDVPISLAIVLATAMSLFETLNGGAHAYFDAAVSLTFFLLIGRFLDHSTRRAARSAAKELAALEVSMSERITPNGTETVKVSDLMAGDDILVPSGARVPVDGRLISDHALSDRSFITGESAAIEISKGDPVQSGEINLGAPVIVKATAVGEETTLRRIAQLVETAESSRNSYTALADRAAQIYAPAVHLLAAVAFIGWWFYSGDLRLSLNIAIAVLIITCPCALALAVPSVSTGAIARLFSAGYIVKHATALDRLAEVSYAVVDKTGTLTQPVNLDIDRLSGPAKSIAKTLAEASMHPKARALAAALAGTDSVDLTHIVEVPGEGVRAMFEGVEVKLGRGAWLNATFKGLGLKVGSERPIGLDVSEELRAGAKECLQLLNLPCEILTGDDERPAQAVSSLLNLNVKANCRPNDKVDHLTRLEAQGERVLMVGDGLNDTAALAKAHASIAPASALDASRVAADIVAIKESFPDLPFILAVARKARHLSQQNFAIALGYNVIAVPIALLGFATPLIAALAMSLSSVTVLLNSQRIRNI